MRTTTMKRRLQVPLTYREWVEVIIEQSHLDLQPILRTLRPGHSIQVPRYLCQPVSIPFFWYGHHASIIRELCFYMPDNWGEFEANAQLFYLWKGEAFDAANGVYVDDPPWLT